MKKVTRFVVAVVLAGALIGLVGCSKPAKPTTTTAPGTAPSTSTSAPVTLRSIMMKRDAILSYSMTTNDGSKTIVMEMSSKEGAPYRSRVDMGDHGTAYMMYDKKEMYMYNPKTNTATKMPFKGSSLENPTTVPKTPGLETAKTPEITSDTLDGVDCWLVTYTDAKGNKMQSWLDKEYGLPRQEKMGDRVIKHTFKDINQVPDADFELPQGAKIVDMSEMMKNMPGMKMPK